ncbi:MAG TPA: hypothetical protein VK563_08305, partial [Puia sp.]|nr:hypothetical protein [Puia sp.]
MRKLSRKAQLFFFILPVLVSCKIKNKQVSPGDINAIDLKKGEVVLCGPPDKQFGTVAFGVSCPAKVKSDFNLAMALLHSFEYDEAEKVFARIIGEEPGCAMAYWGVAMCNVHPLWTPPSQPELEKGAKAIAIARSIDGTPARETAYINAIAKFYTDWNTIDHHTRCVNFE